MGLAFDLSRVLERNLCNGEGLTARALARGIREARKALRELDRRRKNGEIGFPDLPYFAREADRIASHARTLRRRFTHLLLLGIGGSALGAKAVHEALGGGRRGGMRLEVADNVDPDLLVPLMERLPWATTVVAAVSKSGGTAETNAQLAVAVEALKRTCGEAWRERVVIVTDPARGLFREFAKSEGLVSYAVPPNVGGRFSVLSPVGLFPLAAAGISPRRLLAGARWLEAAFRAGAEANPVLAAAAVYAHYLVENRKPVHVWFTYGAGLDRVAEWWQQLWGESLGKRRADGTPVGQTPARATGVTDQHSQLQLYQDGPADKIFTFVTWAGARHERRIPAAAFLPGAETLGGRTLGRLFRSECEGTMGALWMGGRPVVAMEIGGRDEEHLGAFLQFWEWVTAIAGTCAGIDPFDQPGVEASKIITRALLGDRRFARQRRDFLAASRKMGRAVFRLRDPSPPSPASRAKG